MCSCPKRFPREGWVGSRGILGPAQWSHVFRDGLWNPQSALWFCALDLAA